MSSARAGIRHGVLQLFELVVQVADAAAAGDGFVEHRAARHLLDVLAEVADGQLLRHGDLALVGRLLADDHAEDRGLAGAVGPDQADLLAGIQLERGVDEEELLAVLLVDVRERDHVNSSTEAPCATGGTYKLTKVPNGSKCSGNAWNLVPWIRLKPCIGRWIAAVLAAFIATIGVAHPIAANQTADAFRVSTSQRRGRSSRDARRKSNPTSRRTTEVFPGTLTSRYGPLVMTRIDDLLARVGEADRDALVAKNVGAGFDRAITSWRAHPSGRTVALAVRYYRDRLSQLEVEVSDDYGRAEPLDAADYEFVTVAVCTRAGDAWTCREETLAVVAKQHNVVLPTNRAGRDAAARRTRGTGVTATSR